MVDTLEHAVSGPGWICGGQFTAADVYVGSQIDWGLTFGTIPSRPVFEAYAACLRERPVYKRQKEMDNALIAQMQRSEEHTSELKSLMRISYAVFCLKKK